MEKASLPTKTKIAAWWMMIFGGYFIALIFIFLGVFYFIGGLSLVISLSIIVAYLFFFSIYPDIFLFLFHPSSHSPSPRSEKFLENCYLAF